MAKQLLINPKKVRNRSTLELGSIPINQYSRSVREESTSKGVGMERCLRIYRDMALIREFETMLDSIKKLGAYQGIEYNHAGPAHLSIGQEGAAVGQSVHLSVDDHLFGSHRSHGEFIAKGLRAVEDLADSSLSEIMENYFGGRTLSIVEKNEADWSPFSLTPQKSRKAALQTTASEERGIDFLLYGLLAEVFGRETGFNKGMGGSMHAFFPPFGVYPANAIVGGSADISVGAALYKKVQEKKGIAIANIGDASIGCGPVWEALGFSAMSQTRTLWPDFMKGGLPMLFNFMNNFYGMGGQPIGETMGFDFLARVGAAVNAENMHAEVVDGNNPLALADAYARKLKLIKAGKGPVFLDVLCYRQAGHSPSDQSAYREREEIDLWRAVDPITEYGQNLVQAGILAEGDLEAVAEYARRKVTKACRLAVSEEVSPRMFLSSRQGVSQMMYNNQVEEALPGLRRKEDVCMPLEENPRLQAIARKSRSGIAPDGSVLKGTKAVTLGEALFETIIHHFYNDHRLVAYGEENRDWGGAFAVYQGLTEALPYYRLFNSPISEAAIVGTAVGYAMEGGRPLVELMYCDFMGRAGDEVFNQMPKWQAMSAGLLRLPIVLRVSVGAKYGAQHSQDWTALCAHIPGLKVVFPATPYSAKGLLASALSGNDPVVFFESQRLYNQVELFQEGGVPAEYYRLPIGVPARIKEGKDLTVLTFGATLYRALEAAKRFEQEYNLSVEVIDGRTLVPFDYSLLLESVKKTGKVIIASDACERGSYNHTIAGQLTQLAFDDLDAPVCVIGAPNWIVPPAEMEDAYFPQAFSFLDAYHQQIQPLPGYTPVISRTADEMMYQNRFGI
ncbi:MAG TPA: thiamine pyrophosphate-dependent enzyme [Candidatus Hydrogenedentes bacterium]|nr:thiamine pyrophosphate-dependent enzyme [Candidatus Hydrogenedentota bacterium]HOD94428.1 thiamine pyrophosphate-dependent enzyme [Candidatus Hydrogenedentota bacterium]HOR50107.1 thiamine pyrophosphate-dependent enzyme [Candidatus Hydrogenedentota bacterium]HPK24196.1 thiamine pyrophosphate-dependent enzyme [Candidatus Hydrogenedentota bacterium]HPX85407.1 thiamine pyrophosphate-dependent enzyme [Candidatus Hydrogenedentota bacterium]